jgi:transposase
MDGYLAIDVAKDKLDAQLSLGLGDPGKDLLEQPNNPKGFKRLLGECTRAGITRLHVCMEATGAYWFALAHFFFEAGAFVYVVNPARIKAQRKTELRRSKTDRIDKGVILRFLKAQLTELHRWCPPSPAVRKLQSLVRFRESLVGERTAKKNVLKSLAATPSVIRMANEQISRLDDEIAELDKLIQDIIHSDEQLRSLYASATSVPNIAAVTASILLAELRGFAEIRDRRQATAFAGLDVVQEESGTIKKPPRISKTGSKLLRTAFYRVAPCAARRPGQFQDLFLRLRARGLRKKQAYAAVARKLLEITVTVATSGGTFDRSMYQPA